MFGWFLLIVIVVAVAYFVGIYNALVRFAEPGEECLVADRRAAQAAARSDPQSGRNGQGVHAA